MINQGYIAKGYEQLTNLAAAVGLTIPAGTTLIRIVPEAQAVRWRDDGTDPTAAVGMPLAVGVELQYDAGQMSSLKFIEQVVGAKLNVTYYGN
jgi:hypothetical protein